MTDLRRTPLRRLLMLSALMGGASLVEDTATGNPVTFETDVAKPLKSLLIPFTPVQSGTGDPSPQNIRSILPWNGLKVWNGGKNLLNLNRQEGTPNPTTTLVSPRVMDTDHFYTGLHDANYYVKAYANGSVQDGVIKVTSINNNSYGLGFPVAVKGGSKYTFNCTAEKVLVGIGYYDAEWNFISSGGDIYKSQIPATKTTPENASYMTIIFRSSVGEEYTYSDIQLSAGQTATAYEPYKPITETDISFPSPVYGGTLDVVSGELTVEWAEIASYNGETLPGEWLSDRDVYSAGTTPTIGAQVVYKLAEPQEQTLTGHQLTALVGNNTIWSDADGSMTAVYLKKA